MLPQINGLDISAAYSAIKETQKIDFLISVPRAVKLTVSWG